MKFLLSLLFPVLVFGATANSPVIWGPGSSVQLLQPKLLFNGSAAITIQDGGGDPSSVALSAPAGSIYLSSTGNAYLKTDSGLSTNWTVFAGGGAGDITGVTAGTNLNGGGTSGTVTLNVNNPVVANLTGNASTATALAANPTDCAANTFANAIAASGNLTCAAVNLATADVTGVLPLANGGTNKNMTAVNGGIVWTDADSQEVSAAGTLNQVLISGGAAAPTWATKYAVFANLGGANPDLGVVSINTYTEIVHASLTLTPLAGSAAAGTMCDTTNAATAPSTSPTTCAVGNESVGLNFTIPRAGNYEVCVGTSVQFAGDSGEAAAVTFQLIETPTNAQTLTFESGAKNTIAATALTIATATAMVQTTQYFACTIFPWAAAGTKGVRLMYEEIVTATPNSVVMVANASTSVGQREIYFSVKEL